ncbi:MAG: FAD-dependent oxidoreductase, partial [bacterium]
MSITSSTQFESLWQATAPDLEHMPVLDETIECDVGIVGAGYTGLSTALHLAESGGSCVVVD